VADSKQLFVSSLKKRNLKWSRQREVIFDLFLSTPSHVTTEELYVLVRSKFPQIGYSTVHRTLKLLAECGLATENHFDDRYTRFEKVQKNHHHDHLICTECGIIVEFECNKIEKLQNKIALENNFELTNHRMQLYGICSPCRKKLKKRNKIS
jgi:Fur family ferric uptake transcriptional regulator